MYNLYVLYLIIFILSTTCIYIFYVPKVTDLIDHSVLQYCSFSTKLFCFHLNIIHWSTPTYKFNRLFSFYVLIWNNVGDLVWIRLQCPASRSTRMSLLWALVTWQKNLTWNVRDIHVSSPRKLFFQHRCYFLFTLSCFSLTLTVRSWS